MARGERTPLRAPPKIAAPRARPRPRREVRPRPHSGGRFRPPAIAAVAPALVPAAEGPRPGDSPPDLDPHPCRELGATRVLGACDAAAKRPAERLRAENADRGAGSDP